MNTTKAKTPAAPAEDRTVMEPVNLDEFLRTVKLEMATYEKRLATFDNIWRYRDQEGAVCTPERLAKAGFYCSERKPGADAARCYVCQHELLWDPEDNPWEEHCRHRPDCELVKIGKQDEQEFTVLEQLRIMAYIYSTKQYIYVEDSINDLNQLYAKLMAETSKITRK